MTAWAFLEVAGPVLLVTLLFLAGLFLLTRLLKESRRDAQKWQRIVTTLCCPACGSAYDRWDGATWGIDADPPESVRHDHGIVLVCPQCRAAGYVVEAEGPVRVYSTPEEAAGCRQSHS
jgi:hypothetical protein